MILLLPYPTSANRLWRNAGGRMIPNHKAVAWKRTAAILARNSGIRVTDKSVFVRLEVLPRAIKDGSASKVCIDLDNSIKATLDAMNGVAWLDDKQVRKLEASYGEPMKDGGLLVEIIEMEESHG